ncbi:hypothetical protein B0H14DRAFT_2396005 [Mycena olivaceomarginata]|nr:hypothetical protein B0H14DRAFT_2396005 [Mycena olivaceomarginata]
MPPETNAKPKNPGTRTYRRLAPVDPSPVIPTPPPNPDAYRLDLSQSAIPSLPPTAAEPSFPHTQPRLRAPKQSTAQKMADKLIWMEQLLKGSPFNHLGDLLAILFHNPPRDDNPRGLTHSLAVAHFLRGRTDIKMCDILPLMYHHRASYPSSKCKNVHEQKQMFSTSGSIDKIHHARPFISTWATRLVAAQARKQVDRATRDDPDDPDSHTCFVAHTNGRKAGVHVVTWSQLLANFNLNFLPLPMFPTQLMCAPSSKGVSVVRKRHPYTAAQVGAIASFIFCRNRYANGDMALALGVWLFACQAHVDIKRVFSRFGYCVSDTTTRHALVSMTSGSLAELRVQVITSAERGVMDGSLILDNVQEYCDIYEQGIGRQSQLKVGTAGTWVQLEDCAPGAFDAKPYYERVALQERKTLTTDLLFGDINWSHIQLAIPLHWVRVLIEFVPELHPLLQEVNERFRTDLALHRMREGRKTNCQPLGTNSEHSTETQGMERAIADFDAQTGVSAIEPSKLLCWVRGDGASYAAILRLTKYCAPLGTFQNKIATPELWHTGATDLNSTAANHYGPATSSDPSSLSKCSNVAGLKRPSNVKSCDYYPTVRNLTLIWTAHVLDCWRIHFDTDDLQVHLSNLVASGSATVELDFLLGDACTLVDRYATQSAILTSLSASESRDPARENRVAEGTAWDEVPDLVEIEDPDAPRNEPVASKVADDTPKVHQEKEGFTGDRVLRNSQIFMQDFGWWIEFCHSVPEGDIGRAFEIMKIWIFKFAGSSHQNYVNYLLEGGLERSDCMLRYEASKDLNNAILNNWLLNIKGELGRHLPGDQHQEHYNKWLEAMAPKHGGDFDDTFYHETISPNVHHFLEIKNEIETAFGFQHQGQTHTAPHLRGELHLLLTTFKEEQVHLFRSGRSLGHAAVNQFACGFRQLEEDKLADFLDKSTVLGDFLQEFQHLGTNTSDQDVEMRSETPTPSVPDSEDSFESDSTSSTSSRTSSDSEDSEPDAHLDVDDPNSQDEPVDPNEPDDDGEDLSNAQLSSGLTFDPETGLVLTGGEEVDTEDDSDADESGPESELEESEDDGGDEEY